MYRGIVYVFERETLDLSVFFERGANRAKREGEILALHINSYDTFKTRYRFELTHTCASLKESTTV